MKEHKANLLLLGACLAVCLGIFVYRQTGGKARTGRTQVGAQTSAASPASGYSHNDAALDRIVGRVKGLGLKQEERLELRRIYGRYVEERIGHEVASGRVNETTPDDNIVEIPAYEELGSKLKRAMFAEMRAVLGEERMAQVVRQAEGAFDAENNFWGRYPQSLLISRDTKTRCFRIVHAINPGVEKEQGFKRTTVSTLVEHMLLGYEPYRGFLPGKK